MKEMQVITPSWSVPSSVRAFTTTVLGGVSEGDCASLNVGAHVGDSTHHVAENRSRLQRYVGEEVKLCWLNQTHSDIVLDLSAYHGVVEADAAVSGQPNVACVVMTADCLPVLICNASGTKVAALHCGWKGLQANLIGKTIQQYFENESVIAWLGPAIGQASYEVDEALHQRFTAEHPAYAAAFTANRSGHYLFDLYAIARQQLQVAGVLSERVSGGHFDTYTDERFYSYRRSAQTGRMASVIYLT